MANNRMVIVCKVCYPEPGIWEFHTPGCFVLAKYYPSTGYYTANGFTEEKLNQWLNEHRHAKTLNLIDPITRTTASFGDDCLFRMEYEIEKEELERDRKMVCHRCSQ